MLHKIKIEWVLFKIFEKFNKYKAKYIIPWFTKYINHGIIYGMKIRGSALYDKKKNLN